MRCKCGFENVADARFCGNCRSALGDVFGSATPDAAAPSTAVPELAGPRMAGSHPFSRARMMIVAAVVVVAAAGYWWMNRPPGRYKPDNGGLYPVNVNSKFGFMDRSGKTVITPQFDSTDGFSEGLAAVKIGTKWGYINTKGMVVITPQFDIGNRFRYGRAEVQLGNRFGFIDKDGKYICSPDFLWAGSFSGNLAPVKTADGAMAFVDRSGKVVLLDKVDQLRWGFTGGLIPAASGGKWGFIDTAGKWVIDPQFEQADGFADGLALVRVGGRCGYIDQKGKFVVNPQFDSGYEFDEGVAFFRNGRKYGLIDTKGRVVVDAKFLALGMFSDGLAPVKTEAGFGFIDRTGKMVIPPQFDLAEAFQNGLARVIVLGKETYITTTGAFVVEPFPKMTNAPEAITAKRALYELYKPALNWATDLLPLSMTSGEVPNVKNENGKAGMWTAIFFSASRKETRSFTWAAADSGTGIRKGSNVGTALPWQGATPESFPFAVWVFLFDSDGAYNEAVARAADWLRTHPNQEARFRLGAFKTAAPVWYVMWGTEEDGYSTIMSALTGRFIR